MGIASEQPDQTSATVSSNPSQMGIGVTLTCTITCAAARLDPCRVQETTRGHGGHAGEATGKEDSTPPPSSLRSTPSTPPSSLPTRKVACIVVPMNPSSKGERVGV